MAIHNEHHDGVGVYLGILPSSKEEQLGALAAVLPSVAALAAMASVAAVAALASTAVEASSAVETPSHMHLHWVGAPSLVLCLLGVILHSSSRLPASRCRAH